MPITTASGYAADNRSEAPRQYPTGQEKATHANAGKAIATDLANEVDRGK